ncbi:hypothetical protein R5W60_21740 (plasmid) [Brucella pseudintermedia]|uniref:hypothetical protein n=1 Tax=Brucella pseudintermedia TaxID=370111 RepID=UPI002AC8F394|nr:hypothetical protein [Brucella pseudintermedia]WPM83120.1 hypothetical protein R5W60_21740 [Brucella pseudintermedia]
MTKGHIENSREAFERAVIERMKESGFLEIEIRVEALVRCDDGYEDEVINAGWHYWKAGIAAASPPVVALPDDATAEEILKSTIDHPNAVVMLKRLPDARAAVLEEALRKLLHAVCGETGFANAVRQESGHAYPWPALDIAEAFAISALSSPDHIADAGKLVEGDGLPQDVINLVIAAREVWEEADTLSYYHSDEEFSQRVKALDKALEPFGERVPFENEPSAPASEGAE